jgi:uncharacterized protein (UPF0332 family)
MSDWYDLSRQNLRAAEALCDKRLFRGSVSRAYYAAYCHATGRLAASGVHFGGGYQNPQHKKLPTLVRKNLAAKKMADVIKDLGILKSARVEAEYVPSAPVTAKLARHCLRYARTVISSL